MEIVHERETRMAREDNIASHMHPMVIMWRSADILLGPTSCLWLSAATRNQQWAHRSPLFQLNVDQSGWKGLFDWNKALKGQYARFQPDLHPYNSVIVSFMFVYPKGCSHNNFWKTHCSSMPFTQHISGSQGMVAFPNDTCGSNDMAAILKKYHFWPIMPHSCPAQGQETGILGPQMVLWGVLGSHVE